MSDSREYEDIRLVPWRLDAIAASGLERARKERAERDGLEPVEVSPATLPRIAGRYGVTARCGEALVWPEAGLLVFGRARRFRVRGRKPYFARYFRKRSARIDAYMRARACSKARRGPEEGP